MFSSTRTDLEACAAGSIRTIPSARFSPLDVQQTVECKPGVHPAAWRLRDGRISFSTIRGLLVIDPNHIDIKLGPPQVSIESFIIDRQEQTPEQIKRLTPGNLNLDVRD